MNRTHKEQDLYAKGFEEAFECLRGDAKGRWDLRNVVVVGETGSGKSAMINQAVLGRELIKISPDAADEDLGLDVLKSIFVVKDKNLREKPPVIGHSVDTSQTKFPTSFKYRNSHTKASLSLLKSGKNGQDTPEEEPQDTIIPDSEGDDEEIYFVDSGGLYDTRDDVIGPAAICNTYVLKRESLRGIIYLVNYGDFLVARCASLKDQGRILVDLMGCKDKLPELLGKDPDNILAKLNIKFVITNKPQDSSIKHLLKIVNKMLKNDDLPLPAKLMCKLMTMKPVTGYGLPGGISEHVTRDFLCEWEGAQEKGILNGSFADARAIGMMYKSVPWPNVAQVSKGVSDFEAQCWELEHVIKDIKEAHRFLEMIDETLKQTKPNSVSYVRSVIGPRSAKGKMMLESLTKEIKAADARMIKKAINEGHDEGDVRGQRWTSELRGMWEGLVKLVDKSLVNTNGERKSLSQFCETIVDKLGEEHKLFASDGMGKVGVAKQIIPVDALGDSFQFKCEVVDLFAPKIKECIVADSSMTKEERDLAVKYVEQVMTLPGRAKYSQDKIDGLETRLAAALSEKKQAEFRVLLECVRIRVSQLAKLCRRLFADRFCCSGKCIGCCMAVTATAGAGAAVAGNAATGGAVSAAAGAAGA